MFYKSQQQHHSTHRSRQPTSNQFSSRTYDPKENRNTGEHHNAPPPVIFGERVVASENKYAEHLNSVDSYSEKEGVLEDDYGNYDYYDQYGDDYVYNYDYNEQSNLRGNVSSASVISSEGKTRIPIRNHPNSKPIRHKVSNRRNSYVHYNHHGTYLPAKPSNSETHFGSFEHINRRPHR